MGSGVGKMQNKKAKQSVNYPCKRKTNHITPQLGQKQISAEDER